MKFFVVHVWIAGMITSPQFIVGNTIRIISPIGEQTPVVSITQCLSLNKRNQMSKNLQKIKRVIREQLGVIEEQITVDANLANDLNADSLDLVELIMGLEEEFEIEIPEHIAESFNTVQDILTHIDNLSKPD
jgi:acyl carrier protein